MNARNLLSVEPAVPSPSHTPHDPIHLHQKKWD